MVTLATELGGGAYASTHSWKRLEDFVDIDNRMAGQKREAERAESVKDALKERGLLDVTVGQGVRNADSWSFDDTEEEA